MGTGSWRIEEGIVLLDVLDFSLIDNNFWIFLSGYGSGMPCKAWMYGTSKEYYGYGYGSFGKYQYQSSHAIKGRS